MSKLRQEYTKQTGEQASPSGYEGQGAGFNREYVEWLEAKVDFYLDKVKWVDDAEPSPRPANHDERLDYMYGDHHRMAVSLFGPKREDANEAK